MCSKRSAGGTELRDSALSGGARRRHSRRGRPSRVKYGAEKFKFLIFRGLRLSLLWPFLDLLVAAARFYGSETVPKMVPIRSETFCTPVFGRDTLTEPDRTPLTPTH
mgnify:CR=1 FL=1